jgi:hypothetical protein
MLNVSIKKAVTALGLVSVMASGALAKVSPEEAARLGQDLTPLGAEKAGNAAGTIPEWTGGGVPAIPEGHQAGQHHPDVFAGDEVLFTITAENVDQYAENLSEGQLAMFKIYPDTFKMKVYKTRRTAQNPDFVYEGTKNCALTADAGADGNSISGAKACIPFAIPQSAEEVMWNHILRYQGIYRVEAINSVSPDAKGRYVTDKVTRNTYWPYWDASKTDDNRLSMFIPRQLAPARVAGDTFLLIDYMNPTVNPRAAWRYFGGQRRVRRAPVFVFDTPVPPSQGLRTVDAYDMWFGSLQKYNWDGHLDPELPRYELHRVWEIEATLKEGERHIYPRRVMYVDEDTWMIHVHDMYDERGALWRTAHLYSKLFWHAKVTAAANEVHHDLISRRYNAVTLMGEYPKTYDFSQPVPGDSFFTPASIRKMGVR